MRLKPIRIIILYLSIICLQHPGNAQENAAFQQPELDFRLANEMFQAKNFGNSRQLYHEIASKGHDHNPDILTGAAFREAVSAAELNNSDAQAMIDAFIETYPENARTGTAHLYLGKFYFKDNKYRDAIESLQKVNIAGLSKTGREELYFMIGYSRLKTGDETTARAYFQRISNPKSPYYSHAKYFLAHIDCAQGNYDQALKAFQELESERRYEKIIPLYKIQIYHYKGDYQKITEMGPDLVESTGSNNKAEVARITGYAFFNTGDYENAAFYLGIYEKTNRKPPSREDHYLLGFVNYMSGDYKNAIDNFQKAIKQDDALSQNASYYLGVCYNETGQKKYAANAFLAAYKNSVDKDLAEEAFFNYIKVGIESPFNPYNESISLLEDYLREHPDSPRSDECFGYLSQLYLSSRNYKQALASVESVGNKNSKMKEAYQRILFYRAAELFNMQDMEGSLELYNKASEFTYDESIRSESLFWIGEIFYMQKNFWAAIKYYKDFLNSKKAGKSSFYAIAYYDLGYAHFNRKEYPEAIAQFTRFLEVIKGRDPKLVADAYLRLGDAYFISKQYDKAVSNYDKVISAKESSMDYALYHKALSEGAKGDFNRKIDVLKVLINNYPESSYHDDAYYETALAYILLNQESHALIYFDKLVQNYPKSGKALQASLRKGFIYFNRNEYNQAISSFKNVIEKFPGTQEAQEALAALKNIYYETGDVDQYYAYAKGLSFTEINVTEEDSLTYEVAENLYIQGKCSQAIISFKKYLDTFPEGTFAANAWYHQAECYLKSNQLEEALEGFKKVAEKPRCRFTEAAIATASSMEFSSGNYEAALPLFEQLETVSEDPDNSIAAIAGQMRCHFRVRNYPSAILAAQKLLSTGKAPADMTDETHFTLGQCYLATNDLTQAEYEFSFPAKLAGTETGAAASYNLADIAYRTGRLVEAEERVYALSEKFPAHDYWVAKGFILLSDIFLKNGNVFQARETLQSVINNYTGPELGETAKQKLNELPNE
jgi:TolA-binding protein